MKMRICALLFVVLSWASVAYAESYMSYDEIKLDDPKPGTLITLNFLGCEISNYSDSADLSLKCDFKHYTGPKDIYLYVTKEEAKKLVGTRGYQVITCNITELGGSFVTCTTRKDYLDRELARIKKENQKK
jgi:hypothetical protein